MSHICFFCHQEMFILNVYIVELSFFAALVEGFKKSMLLLSGGTWRLKLESWFSFCNTDACLFIAVNYRCVFSLFYMKSAAVTGFQT